MKTTIKFLGRLCELSCDKAWGMNWKGKKTGKAPQDPGTYEGGYGKPTDKKHNKWCARECERSTIKPKSAEVKDE